jgi:hypothetical protein
VAGGREAAGPRLRGVLLPDTGVGAVDRP